MVPKGLWFCCVGMASLAPGLLSELVVKGLAPLAPGFVGVGLVALLVIQGLLTPYH